MSRASLLISINAEDQAIAVTFGHGASAQRKNARVCAERLQWTDGRTPAPIAAGHLPATARSDAIAARRSASSPWRQSSPG